MTTPQLNADQQQAVKAISSFIVGGKKEFLMTGGPGVGKTFTTRELVELLPTILKNYRSAMGLTARPMRIALTSTTNKAAAVLGEECGIPATTIHSFLGLVPKNDYKTGVTHLKTTNQWRVHNDTIIFVDECSMIDAKLYEKIHEGTDDTCKIIFIGDKNQLPPVMEKISPSVVLADEPDKHYEISTPVRNAGAPALLDLCDRLKEDILLSKPKNQFTNWPEVPGQIEYINGSELKDLIDQKFGPNGEVSEKDETLACRILCYTNKTVLGYNQHIRSIRALPEAPIAGEMLVCNNHYKVGSTSSFNVEDEIKVHSVEGPYNVPIDDHNELLAFKLEVTSKFGTRAIVHIPEDRQRYLELRNFYKRRSQWQKYYKMEEQFIDLRNREAATVYKAQGSTYDSVILIMNDIFTCRDPNQLRRMLYVGASRARKKVYLYDRDIRSNARGIYHG